MKLGKVTDTDKAVNPLDFWQRSGRHPYQD